MTRDLYVRSIAPETTEDELRRLFAVAGKVAHVHMVRDARSGEFVGCAYVKMASEAEAREAITILDGALLGSRTILVSAARPRQPQGRPGQGGQGPRGPGRKGPRGRQKPA